MQYNKIILRELGDFYHHFNVLNCEFEMQKSGLSNEYDNRETAYICLIFFALSCVYCLS